MKKWVLDDQGKPMMLKYNKETKEFEAKKKVRPASESNEEIKYLLAHQGWLLIARVRRYSVHSCLGI